MRSPRAAIIAGGRVFTLVWWTIPLVIVACAHRGAPEPPVSAYRPINPFTSSPVDSKGARDCPPGSVNRVALRREPLPG